MANYIYTNGNLYNTDELMHKRQTKYIRKYRIGNRWRYIYEDIDLDGNKAKGHIVDVSERGRQRIENKERIADRAKQENVRRKQREAQNKQREAGTARKESNNAIVKSPEKTRKSKVLRWLKKKGLYNDTYSTKTTIVYK